jgi:small subunit ribosomal protein S9
MLVNDGSLEDYFHRGTLITFIKRPLVCAEVLDKFDVKARVSGGGISGQAGALQLGIARALVKTDEELRSALRREGLLTRDPRMKERKKYGQKGARARFQYSKR